MSVASAQSVGRAAERAVLGELVERTRAGDGGVVLIGGEPGIGKTRLAEDTAAAADGLRVAWGRCREIAEAPPYWPWAQVLRGLGSTVPDPAAGDRFRFFEAVTALLEQAAVRSPLLVVLDDAHRADEGSLRLLGFAADQLWPAPVAMIVAYRDAEAGPTLQRLLTELATYRRCRRLLLDGLSAAEVTAWLRATPAAARAGEVHDRTGGNPFFVGEVARLLTAGGAQIPATVRDVVRSRVALLPAETRRALDGAAVLGRDFTDPALSALLGEGPAATASSLRPAVEAHLLSGDAAGGRRRFVHALVPETLAAGMEPSRRMALHARALAVLPFSTVVEPSQIAHHALAARGAVEAGVVLAAVRDAAQDADRRLAWEDAAGWWRHATELAVAADASAQVQAGIELALARALLRCGEADEARTRFEAVAAAARGRHDGPVLAAAALAVGDVVAEIAPDRALLAVLDEALAAPDVPPAQRVRLTARRAMATAWTAGGRDQARAQAARAVADAEELGDDAVLGAALIARQFTLRGPDDLAAGLAATEQLLALTERHHDEELRFRACQWVIPVRFHAGDLLGATTAVDVADGIATARRDPLQRWWVLLWRALLAGFAGRDDDAERDAIAARTLGRRLGRPAADVYAVAQLLPLYRRAGRVAELEPALRELVSRFPGLPTLSCDLALVLADTGRSEEATALVDALSARDFAALPRDQLVLASWALLGETTVVLRDARRAAPVAPRLAPYAERNLIQGVPVGWGCAAWYLARLAHVCGDPAGARTHAATAAALHERWGARAWGPALADLTAPASAAHGLSAREREVLALLAAGATNRAIAGRLYVSVHTVERHVANIFGKLGLRNRAAATDWAHRHGMVD
ncbi:MAG: helix-turn-helix transcriptional regulator [Pseudonocardia sp.]